MTENPPEFLVAFPGEVVDLFNRSGKSLRKPLVLQSYEELHSEGFLKIHEFDLIILGPHYSVPYGDTPAGNAHLKFIHRLNSAWESGARLVVLVAGREFVLKDGSTDRAEPVVRANYMLDSVIHNFRLQDTILQPGFDIAPDEDLELVGDAGPVLAGYLARNTARKPCYSIIGPSSALATEVHVMPIARFPVSKALVAASVFSKGEGVLTILPYCQNGIDPESLEHIIDADTRIDWEALRPEPETPDQLLINRPTPEILEEILKALKKNNAELPPTIQPTEVAELLGIKLKTLQNRLSKEDYPWVKRVSGKKWVAVTSLFLKWLEKKPGKPGRKPRFRG